MSAGITVSSYFCDEVRTEANGKQIFIGVFTGSIIVPQFPCPMERLCVVTKIRMPIDHHPRLGASKVRIAIPGQPDQTFEVHFGDATEEVARFGEATTQEYQVILRIKFDCVEAGLLRVSLVTDEGTFKAGGIGIQSAEIYNEGALDMNAVAGVTYHFTQQLKGETPAEERQLAVSLRDILGELIGGKVKVQGPAASPDTMLFAAKSQRDFFVLFNRPIKGKPKLEILRNEVPIAHKVERGGPYHCRVILTDDVGAKFNDGLTVNLLP